MPKASIYLHATSAQHFFRSVLTSARFYHKPGVSELAVKTAPGRRLPPPRSRPTPTPVRQDSACAGRLRGPQAIQARLQPPARLPPNPRFLVEPQFRGVAHGRKRVAPRRHAITAVMSGARLAFCVTGTLLAVQWTLPWARDGSAGRLRDGHTSCAV